jgi:hypothetical protein
MPVTSGPGPSGSDLRSQTGTGYTVSVPGGGTNYGQPRIVMPISRGGGGGSRAAKLVLPNKTGVLVPRRRGK